MIEGHPDAATAQEVSRHCYPDGGLTRSDSQRYSGKTVGPSISVSNRGDMAGCISRQHVIDSGGTG
jgi:hypothetical protein